MNPQVKKGKAELPPKRGAVIAKIFGSFAGAVRSAASKAGEVLAKIGSGETTSGGSSTPASPPPSAYASYGFADQVMGN